MYDHCVMSRSLRLLKRAWRCFQDFGFDETLGRTLVWLKLLSSWNALDFYLRDFRSSPISNPDLHNLKLEIREISSNQFHNFSLAEGLPPRAHFEKQFARGSRLFAAFEGNAFVAVNWTHSKSADLTHIGRPLVSLPPGTVYSYGLFVSPAHRNQGIGILLKQFLFHQLQTEGTELVFLAVYLKNIGIHRWHRKVGMEKWGRIVYFNWKGKGIWWTLPTKIGHQHPQLLNHA